VVMHHTAYAIIADRAATLPGCPDSAPHPMSADDDGEPGARHDANAKRHAPPPPHYGPEGKPGGAWWKNEGTGTKLRASPTHVVEDNRPAAWRPRAGVPRSGDQW